MLAAAESVIREGKVDGRSAAAHLAWLWQEGIILQPPQACRKRCSGWRRARRG